MELNQSHYGPQLNNAPVNIGILKTIPVQLFGCTRSSATPGLNGTIGTDGSVALPLDNFADYVLVELRLPSDYDDRTYNANDTWPGDTLKIRVCAKTSGTTITDKIVVSGFSYWRPGTSTTATEPTRSSTQTAAQTVGSLALTEYEFDLSGLGLRPGDAVTAAIQATSSAGSGNSPVETVNIHAIEWLYRGHIIQTDSTDR